MSLIFIAGAVALAVFLLPLLYYRPVFKSRCPACGETHSIERIPRPALVRTFLGYLPTKYYICYSCMKRFLRFA